MYHISCLHTIGEPCNHSPPCSLCTNTQPPVGTYLLQHSPTYYLMYHICLHTTGEPGYHAPPCSLCPAKNPIAGHPSFPWLVPMYYSTAPSIILCVNFPVFTPLENQLVPKIYLLQHSIQVLSYNITSVFTPLGNHQAAMHVPTH